jgi:hypothetical protein
MGDGGVQHGHPLKADSAPPPMLLADAGHRPRRLNLDLGGVGEAGSRDGGVTVGEARDVVVGEASSFAIGKAGGGDGGRSQAMRCSCLVLPKRCPFTHAAKRDNFACVVYHLHSSGPAYHQPITNKEFQSHGSVFVWSAYEP